jgi:hypothetical protein
VDRDGSEKYGYALYVQVCTAIRSDAANGEDLSTPFYSQCLLFFTHGMLVVSKLTILETKYICICVTQTASL